MEESKFVSSIQKSVKFRDFVKEYKSSLALDVSPLKTRKPTVWHEVLAGFNFYDFSSDPQR